MTGAATRSRVTVADLASSIEDALSQTLPALEPAGASTFGVDRLVDSMRYSLRTPGKRIRPLLLLAVAESLGTESSRLVRFAAGLEMIHAYSLIHDDLPAMDDDDLRRGMPTNHVVYGDGIAILAGDALLTEAFVVMLEPVCEPALQALAIGEIARAAGREGMVGGQAADLMADGLDGRADARAAAGDVELLHAIHARKTGALLRASARVGGLLAGAGETDLQSLTRFGTRFGLAFQIADDIKDEIAPTVVTGKREGGDRQAGKLTYPSLFGVPRSQQMLREELDAALAELSSFSRDASLLVQVATEAVAPALAHPGA
ncbi:MAG TPA: farnesyl diphosphate synthase [Candidatus Binatia bacterium]|jgi:geranylgeranyl diphosphate synthase type II